MQRTLSLSRGPLELCVRTTAHLATVSLSSCPPSPTGGAAWIKPRAVQNSRASGISLYAGGGGKKKGGKEKVRHDAAGLPISNSRGTKAKQANKLLSRKLGRAANALTLTELQSRAGRGRKDKWCPSAGIAARGRWRRRCQSRGSDASPCLSSSPSSTFSWLRRDARPRQGTFCRAG